MYIISTSRGWHTLCQTPSTIDNRFFSSNSKYSVKYNCFSNSKYHSHQYISKLGLPSSDTEQLAVLFYLVCISCSSPWVGDIFLLQHISFFPRFHVRPNILFLQIFPTFFFSIPCLLNGPFYSFPNFLILFLLLSYR